jgi:hypothetical protein
VSATDQIEPVTGTTTEAMRGVQHLCGSLATGLDSPADYAYAESVLHARRMSLAKGRQEAPIAELLGPEGHTRVMGYYQSLLQASAHNIDLTW